MSKDGVCCNCGYDGEEETECVERSDKTHCVHWWEGCDTGTDQKRSIKPESIALTRAREDYIRKIEYEEQQEQ